MQMYNAKFDTTRRKNRLLVSFVALVDGEQMTIETQAFCVEKYMTKYNADGDYMKHSITQPTGEKIYISERWYSEMQKLYLDDQIKALYEKIIECLDHHNNKS